MSPRGGRDRDHDPGEDGGEPQAERRIAPGKVTSTSLIGNPDPPRHRVAPGKRTLTMSLPAVQARGRLDPQAAVQERAAAGVGGPGGRLPFLDQIQPAFGRHDVGGIEAHVGGPAAGAAADLGAEAYATGNHVAFGQVPTLHTAAHEAAHVVQQRGGVQLKDGVGRAGDAYEQHADQVADRVVAGESVEALLDVHAGSSSSSSSGASRAIQRHPLGGALVTEEDMRAREADRDVFPGPVKLSVLGDPFEVRLARTKGKLTVTITYLGPFPVDATAAGTMESSSSRSLVLAPDRRRVAGADPVDENRPYAARVVSRGEDQLVYDLHGDGGSILEVRDQVDGDGLGRFDRRTHQLSARLNGFPTMPGFLAVRLPVGGASDGDERVASTHLDLNGDAFALRARRHGDSNAVVLSLAHAQGEDQVIVPLEGDRPGRITLAVLRSDGRDIELDLDGDGQLDARLVHTVHAPRRRGSGMRPSLGGLDDPLRSGGRDDDFYVHDLAAYDRDGVRVGTMVQKLPGTPGAIPPAQDAALSPAPAGASRPDDRAPIQGDLPGETPRAVQHSARDWELRIDGDGDRTKEIVLRFAPRPAGVDQPQPYAMSVTQLSSGATAGQSFTLSAEQARAFDAIGPQLVTATDGETAARIQLGPTPSAAPVLVFYEDSFYAPDRTTYRANLEGAQAMVFSLPRETRATAWMTDQEAPPSRQHTTGTIETIDVELSEYRDRFRLTAEKVDAGDVVLGVSAVGPEGPVAGFSTRLIGIAEPRLEPHADLPTQLSFYVRKEWGFANLHLTSALDPPKDPQGRVIDGPPSAHRDHRISLHGETITGRPQHTFRVRDGRFVAGWEESKDNRHAAGAAQAVGILDEQHKHPQLDEFRIQIDAAVDAEIQKAVKLGWIDGLTADAWTALKGDMIFVQAQLAGGTVASERITRAASAAEAVASWLTDSTRGVAALRITGSRRRLAPGEAVGPGGLEPISGTGFDPNTGESWAIRDGVVAELREAGYGVRTARSLEEGKYGAAVESYQKLRNGVGRWIGSKFAADPKFGPSSPEAARMAHLSNLSEKLQEMEGVQRQMRALDAALDVQVALAGQRGLVDERTVGAWNQLRDDMVVITAQTASGKADQGVLDRALEDARTIDWWLELETGDRTVAARFGRTNPFTGEKEIIAGADQWLVQVQTHGRVLRAHLQAGDYGQASEAYRGLRNGVVKWITQKTEDRYGKGSAELAAVSGPQKAREARRDVVRIPATFIADESYEKMPDKGSYKQKDFGKYRQVPLQLFVWADGDEWQIRDLHNPQHVWEARVDYNGEAQPPEELFKKLDHKRHLPKGTIRYELPDGSGNRVRCEAEKEWYEWVADIALVLAAVGLILVTLGAATPLVVGAYATAAFAASAVFGTVASIGELADGLDHGFADTTMIMLNVLDIVGNIMSLGAMGGGKLAMGAARAATAAKAGTGAAWTGAWSWMARAGSLSYRTLTGISIATGGAQLLVMTGDLERQLDEVDKTIKDPHDRRQAKALLIAQFAVTGGMVLLSIKGDLPDLRTGAPSIVLDRVNGVTIARLADVKLGDRHINLPDGDANMHAAARWQSQDIELEAAHGASPESRKRAGDLLHDEDFQRWYAKWMEQPDKLVPGRARPTVAAPEGAPPAVVKRLQQMVDQGDLVLHEKAFARADDVAELRAAAGDLDIDPRNTATWPEARKKLVDRLGGDERARRLVARYETARLGAGGPMGDFAAQRGELTKVVPESEIERIRDLFPEHEVYLTTEPAAAGRPRGDHVEVAVVVKNGTDPDVMHVIEQRAQGHAVRPDPDYLKRERLSQDQTMPLRAKVMTEDQFFGMATASMKGRGAPRYHRLGDDLAGSLGLGAVEVRALGDGRYLIDPARLVETREAWKRRAGDQVSRVKYDADSHAMYFEIHGAGKGARVRIEAPLPGRITSAADWKLSNRIVGTTTFADPGKGKEILRAISRGDVDVIPRELGVAIPKGFNTADGLEFGLGELPDGRFVIVRGEIAAVDWSKLPGVKADGHTHPSVKGNDLDEDVPGGARRVSIDRLQEVTDVPLLQRAKVYPSPGDVEYMSHHRIRDHGVFTPFVVADGFVMKPGADWAGGNARLEFRVLDAVEVGRIGVDGPPVHRATIVGFFEGKEVLRSEVHVTPPSKADPDGAMHMKEPDGFVAHGAADLDAAGPGRSGQSGQSSKSGKTGMATRAESEAHLRELEGRLSKEGRAELDEISAGKQPEEVWGILHGKGDPQKFLEGRARRKSGAAGKAADKDVRVTEAHQRLRDSGFFDSPLVKKAIASGDADGLRGRISEQLAVVNAKAEFQGMPDHVVLDDVDVSRRFGDFKTRAEAEASLPPDTQLPLYELDGAVWERLTNFDVLVLHQREIVRMQEVKSGRGAAGAKDQQQKGLDALKAIADGDTSTRLHHHRRTDITGKIDAGTGDASKARTTGPDNLGYEMKLGVTTTDLNRLVDEILKAAAAAKKVGE